MIVRELVVEVLGLRDYKIRKAFFACMRIIFNGVLNLFFYDVLFFVKDLLT